MSDVVLNLKITGDGKDGSAAIQSIVTGLKQMGVAATETGVAANIAGGGMNAFTGSVKQAISSVGGLIIATLGVRDFIGLGLAALENARSLKDMSQQTGLTTEFLSVLQFQARKSGFDLGELSTGVRGLSLALERVQEGNIVVIQAFNSLGLSGRELVKVAAGPGGMQAAFLQVVDAMVKFEDGGNKNAIMSNLLGGRVSKLIPVLQSLAGDGFAKAATDAERLGLIMREADVEAAEAFQQSILSLKEQTGSLSQALLEGLVPGLQQAVTNLDAADGSTKTLRDGMKEIGEVIGNFAKLVVFAFTLVADVLNTEIFALKSFKKTALDLFAGDIPGAITSFMGEFKRQGGTFTEFLKAAAADVQKSWKDLFTPPPIPPFDKAREDAINAFKKSVDALKAAGKAADPVDLTTMTTAQIVAATKANNGAVLQQIKIHAANELAIFKATSDSELAILDARNAIVKEKTAQFVQAATASFDQGSSSLTQFFAARRQAIETDGAAEVSAAKQKITDLQRELNKTNSILPGGIESIALASQLAVAQSNLGLVQVKTQGQLNALTDEEITKRKDLNIVLQDFYKALDTAQGQAKDAAIIGLNEQMDAYKISLGQIGLTSEEILAKLALFRKTALTTINVTDAQKDVDALTAKIANNQTLLTNMVNSGIISADEATIRQTQFIAAQGGTVDTLITAFKALKDVVEKTTGDPAVLNNLDAQIEKLNAVKVAAKGAQTQIGLFGQNVFAAGGNAILTFLNELTDGSHTVAQAFQDMALGFLKAVASMINQILAIEVVTVIAHALDVPIPKGFATGGIVPGSGNGDTVRAMLTPGEFVMSTKMVDAMGGLSALERMRLAINGGGPITRGGVSHFAAGGIVSVGGIDPTALSADITRVIIEAHPDLVVRQIESGPGSRAVIRSLKNNRQSANSALGK